MPAREPPNHTQLATKRTAAVRDLDAAIAEETRLGNMLDRAAGTPLEQPAYSRLCAASDRVVECDQTVEALAREPRTTRRRTRVSLGLGPVLAFAVDGGPQAPGDARAEFGAHFAGRLSSERLEVGKLLLSEVVTNCVRHGAAGGAGVWINVTAANTAHVLHVEVWDNGPVFSYRSRWPAAGDTTGRGLSVVEALSSRWGRNEHGRARVWFELETPAAGGSAI